MSLPPKSSYVIRCPIHGTIEISDREKALIDSPSFQRLRHISQLGLTSYVFPSAVHSRFSHSLGSMHLAGRMFDQLVTSGDTPLRKIFTAKYLREIRQIIRMTALLHDLGHPPFSHAFEKHLPPLKMLDLPSREAFSDERANHEDFSILLIRNICQKNPNLISEEESVAITDLIRGKKSPDSIFEQEQYELFDLMLHLINSELDVDRMDYLLRDSYFAGVMYGKFDLDHIIRSIFCYLPSGSQKIILALDGGGVTAYENFLLARAHMFIQVYFHKTVCGFDHFLGKAIEEELSLTINGNPDSYLALTEHVVFQEIARCSDKKWSGKIERREPMKVLSRLVQPSKSASKELKKRRDDLRKAGIETFYWSMRNRYSNQFQRFGIEPRSIMVKQINFGKTLYTTVASASTLLQNAPNEIVVEQLSILPEYQKQVLHYQK